jgi:hypothetical protein
LLLFGRVEFLGFGGPGRGNHPKPMLGHFESSLLFHGIAGHPSHALALSRIRAVLVMLTHYTACPFFENSRLERWFPQVRDTRGSAIPTHTVNELPVRPHN